MKRIFYLLLLALLFLTLSLFPSIQADAQPKSFSPHRTALELIDEVNALREANGLTPYQVNSTLMSVAQTHADYIAEEGVLSHFSADGKRPYQRALDAGYAVAGDLSVGGLYAENIHSGIDLMMAEVIQTWQGHSSNSVTLLSKEYVDVGAGIAVANGVTYFVLDVGAESSFGLVTLPATSTATQPSVTGTGVAILPNTPQADGEILHVVGKNEALWSIALAYDTTIEELKFLNGLAGDEIFEGQTLVIRLAATPTVEPSPVVTEATATFGIPTSTATSPVTPTITPTPTPIPSPPTTLENGGIVVGGIALAALLAAGIGAYFGRKKTSRS